MWAWVAAVHRCTMRAAKRCIYAENEWFRCYARLQRQQRTSQRNCAWNLRDNLLDRWTAVGLHANLRMWVRTDELLGIVFTCCILYTSVGKLLRACMCTFPYLLHTHSVKELHHVANCMAGCMPHCEAASSADKSNQSNP